MRAPLKIAVFSTKSYDKKFLTAALHERYADPSNPDKLSPNAPELIFHEFPLTSDSVSLAHGSDAVCVFVNDALPPEVLTALYHAGVRAVFLRCAGFNNVSLTRAEELGIFVSHVPSYSPEAVAEFAVALIQTLNRKTHRAYNRVREGNFALEGLLGKTLHGKTVGIVGVGRIGIAFAKILKGFGCSLLAFDPQGPEEFKELGSYSSLEDMLPKCDFVSLHCPLFKSTRHIINETTLKLMKPGSMLVNTSRGGLIDTSAVIEALKSGQLGGLALDVYEAEGTLFYNDHSEDIIQDDMLMRLMTFPNVLVCGHQAFFTEEALHEIADCTLRNAEDFATRRPCERALVEPDYAALDAESAIDGQDDMIAPGEDEMPMSPIREGLLKRRESIPVRI